MSGPCGERHPDRPDVECGTRGPDHTEHTGWADGIVCWPNESYVAPLLRDDREARRALRNIAVEAGRRLSAPRDARGRS